MMSMALRLVCDNCFYFELFFSFNKVRRRLQKVGSMGLGFMIRRKKRDMEDRVNMPLAWEF